jgi:hypothetical protein
MASNITSKTTGESFKLVPIKYDLMQVDSYAALSHIRNLTALVTSISPDFMLRLCNNLIDRHNTARPTVFGYMPAPVREITQQVIGTDGYYFKTTTNTCGVDFIWHDRENGMFLFWASSNFRIVKAMNAIRWRINKFTCLSPLKLVENVPKNTEEEVDDTDYSDMPPLIPCNSSEFK